MMSFDFNERLAFSVKANGRPWEDVIRDALPGVASVQKTDTAQDKTGVDYVATLRRGAVVWIDLKLRDAGCSRFWQIGIEELALEIWSVKPADGQPGKAGWTLDEAKATHYTLHAFAPVDSNAAFLIPFQLLRKAFRERLALWTRQYRRATQSSGTWQSECLFVPAPIVLDAVAFAGCLTISVPPVPPQLDLALPLA